MKKIAFTGIVIFLVMFLWTCDAGLPDGDEVLGYTDVEYSEDGQFVTVYLDGSKPVPVTKAYRAMTTNLSRMAYDYIEVVFHAGAGAGATPDTSTLARASWDLGQSAGISGVYRGAAATGIDYTWSATAAPTATTGVALMAVGRKNGKTLLGIGRILQVDRAPTLKAEDMYVDDTGAILGGTGFKATIFESTKSVTFWIESVKTGLAIKDEKLTISTTDGKLTYLPTTMPKIVYDSFNIAKAGTTMPLSGGDLTDNTKNYKLGASRSAMGRMSYPLYPLSETYNAEAIGQYEFGGAAKTFKDYLKYSLDDLPLVEKRFPRYLDGGNYREPPAAADTDSTVKIATAYTTAATPTGSPLTTLALRKTAATTGNAKKLNNVVTLDFVTKGYGLFSFYIEIPVYLYIWTETVETTPAAPPVPAVYDYVNKSTNSGPDSIPWKIRTGLGSELYSLDDGLSSGGCVLMGVGISAMDWLEIEWNWVN